MTRRNQRAHSPAFKAKMALVALKDVCSFANQLRIDAAAEGRMLLTRMAVCECSEGSDHHCMDGD